MKAPSPLRPHGLPNSPDGVQKIPIGVTTTPNTLTFQSQMCGVAFGIETMSIAQALVSKFHMMSCHLMWSNVLFACSWAATLHSGSVHGDPGVPHPRQHGLQPVLHAGGEHVDNLTWITSYIFFSYHADGETKK